MALPYFLKPANRGVCSGGLSPGFVFMGQFFESLEQRNLMAASLNVHTLNVTGTPIGDQIEIVRPKGASYVRVSINGSSKRFPIDQVTRINVAGQLQNDEITVS